MLQATLSAFAPTRLLYVSRRLSHVSDAVVRGLTAHAAERNAALRVSGLLLVGPDWFVQLLEGEQRCVDCTYRRIERDTRHTEVRLLEHAVSETQICPEWGMALATKLPPGFDPRQLSAAELLRIVAELAQ